MTGYQPNKFVSVGMFLLLALTSLSTSLTAQTVKINGMIKARSGATVLVQTSDSPKVVVLLNDQTQVGQIEGVLKVRRKEMSMAALIPGLEVQVEGAYDSQNQLVAKVVKFKGDDLERAQAIQAGLHETQAQAGQNTEDLKQQQKELTAQQQKIAANNSAIETAIARFGQLDDYYILDEVTVLFGNGKVAVDGQYVPQLLKLAEKAKTIDGYNVQVVGYASSSGSTELNQKLSEERAGSVTNILVQQGDIPLTRLLAPGAMGESRQVGDNTTEGGQAENRRVVVRVLQNKGIAGLRDVH